MSDPFGRSERHIRVHRVLVPVLDDVDVLHPEEIAGAHHGAGVVRLVDVLQHHGDMARALGCDTVEELAFVVRDELR
jgi:hypothetical protein